MERIRWDGTSGLIFHPRLCPFDEMKTHLFKAGDIVQVNAFRPIFWADPTDNYDQFVAKDSWVLVLAHAKFLQYEDTWYRAYSPALNYIGVIYLSVPDVKIATV